MPPRAAADRVRLAPRMRSHRVAPRVVHPPAHATPPRLARAARSRAPRMPSSRRAQRVVRRPRAATSPSNARAPASAVQRMPFSPRASPVLEASATAVECALRAARPVRAAARATPARSEPSAARPGRLCVLPAAQGMLVLSVVHQVEPAMRPRSAPAPRRPVRRTHSRPRPRPAAMLRAYAMRPRCAPEPPRSAPPTRSRPQPPSVARPLLGDATRPRCAQVHP